LFAHFLMRRTAFLAFALMAPLVAYAGAAPATHHPKSHHSKAHHPRSNHPAPHHPKRTTSSLAKSHQQLMRLEAARHKHLTRKRKQENAQAKAERRKGRAIQNQTRRRAKAEHKKSRKAHSTAPVPGSNVGESRLKMEHRSTKELQARYDEAYRAGYEAGLLAARKERASACVGRPGETSRDLGARSLASAGPVAKAPVRPEKSASAASDAAAAGATVAFAVRPVRRAGGETTSLDLAPAPHQPPVTLKASLHMLHERMPPPLRGSLASLERQNKRLEAEGLQRIEDKSDLENRIAHRLLVPLPVSGGLTVNPSLPDVRRYCRPWTAEFLSDLARMHDAVFHRSLRVDSAVRTVDYQQRLRRINANAAPATGNIASPHETGATIDIGKRGMTWREIGWMRHYLLTLQDKGLIDVEEEFRQACFHITVYDTYGRLKPARTTAGVNLPYDSDRGVDTAAVDSSGQ